MRRSPRGPREEARLTTEAQRISGARYLSATEVTEAGVLTSLGEPAKDEAALPGVRKLLAGVKGLGLGAGYQREATPLAGTVVSFATGIRPTPTAASG